MVFPSWWVESDLCESDLRSHPCWPPGDGVFEKKKTRQKPSKNPWQNWRPRIRVFLERFFNENKMRISHGFGIFPSSSDFPSKRSNLWYCQMATRNPGELTQLKLVVEIPWFTGFLYIQNGGWPGDFWTINSIYSHFLLQTCAIPPSSKKLLPEPLLSNDACGSSAVFKGLGEGTRDW